LPISTLKTTTSAYCSLPPRLGTKPRAREVLDKDGQTFTDRFDQPKERPEVGILQNARIAFAGLLRELALDGIDAPEAPRMSRTRDYGRRA